MVGSPSVFLSPDCIYIYPESKTFLPKTKLSLTLFQKELNAVVVLYYGVKIISGDAIFLNHIIRHFFELQGGHSIDSSFVKYIISPKKTQKFAEQS